MGQLETVFNISFPPAFSTLLAWIVSTLTLDLPALMPLDCIGRLDANQYLVIRTAFPLGLMGVLLLAGWVARLVSSGAAWRSTTTVACFYILFFVKAVCESITIKIGEALALQVGT